MTTLGPRRPRLLPSTPEGEEGAAPGLGQELSRRAAAVPRLRRRRTPAGITRLDLGDLSFERVLDFLGHLEAARQTHPHAQPAPGRLHTFFDYLAGQAPEMLAEAERVAAIPMKRVPPPGTRFLERDEIDALFAALPQGAPGVARPCAPAVPVQHRRPRAGGRRICASAISCSTPPAARPSARQGRQVADLPALGGDRRLLRDAPATTAALRAPDHPVFTSATGAP